MLFTRVEWPGIDPGAPIEVHPITTRRPAEFRGIGFSALPLKANNMAKRGSCRALCFAAL